MLESTLHHLGDKIVGLPRADSGFFDETVLSFLEDKGIAYIVAARLTQPLQRALYHATGWWALEPGLELTELRYRAAGWASERRLIVVRQSVKRKTAPGKTLSRHDEAFHTALVSATGNAEMARVHVSLTEKMRIIRHLDFTREDRVDATYSEHAQVLRAIAQQQTEEAQRILTAHISQSKAEVRKITLHRLQQARLQPVSP